MGMMFFNRRTTMADVVAASQEALRRLKAAAEAKPQAEAPAHASEVRQHGFSNSTAMLVLQDVLETVGIGDYLPFTEFPGGPLQAALEANVALLVTPDKVVTILHTPDFAWRRQTLEIARRCSEAGLSGRERVLCTDAVIKTLHARHQAATVKAGALEHSDAQRIAFELARSAVEKGASDIHIETRGPGANVFFRINGERYPQPMLATATALEVMRVLYNVHADAGNAGPSWDSSVVQDTAIEHLLADGMRVQLRFNTAPIFPSPNVQCTMRVLRMDGDMAAKPLEDVGYTPAMVEAIEEMLVGSSGLVLLVGPTNVGKSTSLQSFIQRIYERRGRTIKVVTIEDPVEYVIPGACQMGVPRGRLSPDEIALIYRNMLNSLLRQDCDVALVGEIRSAEQAEPVKNMVLAGRKILTTLHAYEAMGAFERLREIGMPDSSLMRSEFISGIINQRLLPLLCQECSFPLEVAYKNADVREATYQRVLRVINLGQHEVKTRNRLGCTHCKGTGIVGRTVCAEILVPDATFLRLMRERDEAGARAHWLEHGINTDGAGVTAVAQAIQKMRLGLVDPNDVESQIGRIQIEAAPLGRNVTPLFDATTPEYSEDYSENMLGLGGRNSGFLTASA